MPCSFGDAAGFLLEDGDEFAADDLALLLRVFDAGEFAEEEVGGIDGVDVEAELVAQVLLHLLEFVLAQHSVVDEDAGQLVADGAMHQHRGDGGIDAAGESADHAAGADLLADGLDGFVDEALRRPVGREAADVEDEVAQDGSSLLGVVHFGMELHGVVLARGIFEGGLGVRGLRDKLEAGRKFFGFVAVRHPDVQRAAESLEEGAVVAQEFDVGVSVLALVAGADFAAELLRHEVQAVTDAQHRQAEMQHLLVQVGASAS